MHPSLFNARPSVCTEDLGKAVQRDEIAQRSGDRLPQLSLTQICRQDQDWLAGGLPYVHRLRGLVVRL